MVDTTVRHAHKGRRREIMSVDNVCVVDRWRTRCAVRTALRTWTSVRCRLSLVAGSNR